MTHPTFLERFCAAHQVSRDQFGREVLKRCLYPHARVLAPLIEVFSSEFFEADRDLIHSAGLLRRTRDLSDEIDEFVGHPANRGMMRRVLRVRISSGRLRRLMKETLPRSTGRETQEPFGAGAGVAEEAS